MIDHVTSFPEPQGLNAPADSFEQEPLIFDPQAARRAAVMSIAGLTTSILIAVLTVIPAAYAIGGPGPTFDTLGEKDGEPLAYIGEGEDISDRIRNHDTNKDWWNTAVLIVSSANNLNKAHVKYLESRLIDLAKSIAKIKLAASTLALRKAI